ncbi:MAG TPA: ABC transporter substrate-binding protein [Nitrososphaerales archaeon]|nr:ABC transporter substrate-binding protein [Nitrososphaerales archaeon]
MQRKNAVLALTFLFVLGFSSVASTFGSHSSNTSLADSCPSSQTLKFTTFPLPASFSMLTSTTLSGYIMAAMLEQTVYPYATYPNGSLYWQNSVTDQVLHNANYTQWTFHVKPGLKWSDGTNLTAQDILNTYGNKYAFNSSYDLVAAGPEVANSVALNSSTAVFNLNVSDAHFPERISLMIFENVQPPSAFQKGPGASLFDQNVTDGPFYVSTPYVSGNPQVQLTRNPYFNPTPGACGMIMNFVESSSQLSEFLASGTTDLAGPLDPSSVKAIVQNQNIHILDEKGQNVMSMQYNITNYPYNMTQFRQALVYGINQSQIQSQALAGYSINAYSAEGDVSPVVPLYNPNVAQYSFNQSKALALLSQIGITQSGGKLHYANGTAVSINLVTDSDQTFDIQAANVVTANLQSMGFTVNSQVLAGSTITGDFPSNQNGIQQAMILYTSIGGAFFPNAWADARPGNIVYQLSYGVGANYWEYPPNVDAEYQGNVSAIDNTSDPVAQKLYIGNIQAISAQNLPTVILGYPDELWAFNTQRWTNWPTSSSSYLYDGDWVNQTLLASLQPVGASTSTSNSSTPSSSTSSSSASSSNSVPSSSTTSSSSIPPVSSSNSTALTSSTSSSSGGISTALIAGVVVVVIVVVAVGVLLMRRKPKAAS